MLGLTPHIPAWVAPARDPRLSLERTFFHRDWLIPILLMIGFEIISAVDHFGLGYALYRFTSDVEKLPFPMAPVGALGNMALAESTERETSWKWRVFSIGGMIGLVFGALYVLLPAASGVILSEPIRLFPIPWIELTHVTEDSFPAVATGIQLDLGLLFIGMVLPFWAVIGGRDRFPASPSSPTPSSTSIGILHRWHKGMGNGGHGLCQQLRFLHEFRYRPGAGHCGVGHLSRVFQLPTETPGDLFKERLKSLFSPPPGRGDFSIWIALGIYVFSTTAYIYLSSLLVPGFPWIFLVAYGFIYTPIHFLRVGANGRDCRAVREPAHGAGSQFHRRFQVFWLPRASASGMPPSPSTTTARPPRGGAKSNSPAPVSGASSRPRSWWSPGGAHRQPALFPIHLATGAHPLGNTTLMRRNCGIFRL